MAPILQKNLVSSKVDLEGKTASSQKIRRGMDQDTPIRPLTSSEQEKLDPLSCELAMKTIELHKKAPKKSEVVQKEIKQVEKSKEYDIDQKVSMVNALVEGAHEEEVTKKK